MASSDRRVTGSSRAARSRTVSSMSMRSSWSRAALALATSSWPWRRVAFGNKLIEPADWPDGNQSSHRLSAVGYLNGFASLDAAQHRAGVLFQLAHTYLSHVLHRST